MEPDCNYGEMMKVPAFETQNLDPVNGDVSEIHNPEVIGKIGPERLKATSGPTVGGDRRKGPQKAKVPSKPSGDGTGLAQELESLPEFKADLKEIAASLEAEKKHGLKLGELAHKWIGHSRYSRVLNNKTFAGHLKTQTGKDRDPRQIGHDIAAYKMHVKITESGNQFPHLTPTHLAKIKQCHCEDDAELLELARRVNDKKASVSQIKQISMSLHQEKTIATRTIRLAPKNQMVWQMDALDLLAQQDDNTIECLILDWQWLSSVSWSRTSNLAKPYCVDDPIEHLSDCIKLAKDKLHPDGLIYVHYTACSWPAWRIYEAATQSGFKLANEFIWQKVCGNFQNGNSPFMIGHEPIFVFCRESCIPKSCIGGVNTVSPKMAAPTRPGSGEKCWHPHQKPVELYELLIGVATVNGLVVDLFAGSGSAGVAAIKRGCPYVGADMNPECVTTANERIAFAHCERETMEEAISFFLKDASTEQSGSICDAIEKSGLQVFCSEMQKEAA